MPFYKCQPWGVKYLDLDLGEVYLEKDKDNAIELSYDHNVFLQSIGIELVLAYPLTTWTNAGVIIINRIQHNILHVTSTSSQKYRIIVRVFYQNPHS